MAEKQRVYNYCKVTLNSHSSTLFALRRKLLETVYQFLKQTIR